MARRAAGCAAPARRRCPSRGLRLEFDDHVQVSVQELRERMHRVDRERREHGIDLLFKKLVEVRLLIRRQRAARVKLDRLRGELRLELIAPAGVIDRPQAGARARKCARATRWQRRRPPRLVRVRLPLLLETGHAHLEKLVEIRTHDAEEFQPLEERVRLVQRLVEHALVELQPAQLAIDEVFRVTEIHYGRHRSSFPAHRVKSCIITNPSQESRSYRASALPQTLSGLREAARS